jgi:hypothetical protein
MYEWISFFNIYFLFLFSFFLSSNVRIDVERVRIITKTLNSFSEYKLKRDELLNFNNKRMLALIDDRSKDLR